MTAQLLATELANLIQESKRKNSDLRQASEKSLDELKSIRATSEAQVAAELSQRINFVNPFVIACGTKNVKFTSIAIVCLQRLVVTKALPRSKLSPVLEALREATSAGLDVQLKILQALPSLLQNYATDVKGDLLVTALNICFILQTSKNAIVNNTSAATLQQLVVSVFDKVVAEDKNSGDAPTVGEAPTENGTVQLREAALDAHRVFNDLCLMTENQRPEYLRFTAMAQTFGLELIESVLTNHTGIFTTHAEQAHVLRKRVMPLLISSLSGKANFATTVRTMRILYTLLKRHLNILPAESGNALDLLTQLLDQDTALWKRSLCMEVFRGIFSEPALLRRIFMLYDAQKGQKNILKNLTATFVRLSTEKPSVIGLGHQSTIPVANPYANIGASTDQVMLEAGGVTGMMGASSSEGNNTGISTQWSTVRVPCIDQLDKTEPPAIPESYIYSLTLSCITSLSEGLAKFILPLTVPSDSRGRKRVGRQDTGRDSPAPSIADDGGESQTAGKAAAPLERSASFKRNPVPVNPLALHDHPLYPEVEVCAAIVDECWPAILATCSTFLYAALDSEYYHSLVRAFQKFAHVAGLLQLATPRDAFLTTLGKAAVPPNVFTACLNAGTPRPTTPTAGADGSSSSSLFSNARGLLSVDNLTQGSPMLEKPRQLSADSFSTSLNTRNLLCLRALLNLGIALGPTLSASWRIVLETLQQADFVLFSSGKVAGRTPTATRQPDQQAELEVSQLLANFGTEIRAVETAASRLFESTVDFPNDAFVAVVDAVCNLLERRTDASTSATAAKPPSGDASRAQSPPSTSSPRPSSSSTFLSSSGPPPLPHGSAAPAASSSSSSHRRVLSISTASPASGPNQEDQFALAKLGDVAAINVDRLLAYPPAVSGWTRITTELIATLGSAPTAPPVRSRAAEILVRLVLECATAAAAAAAATTAGAGGTATTGATTARSVGGDEHKARVQLRLLEAFRDALAPLQAADRYGGGPATNTIASHAVDVDIHKVVLDGLKSLLENCGESLVAGWDLAFEIIGTIFVDGQGGARDRRGSDGQLVPLLTRSGKLIRASFNSLQLICSDFLASLPNSCFLILVDTLYKFCSQEDDLNIALTTVTFFWVLSDFLSSKTQSLAITEDLLQESSDAALVEMAANPDHPAADAALWMLLLLRLTTVTADNRLELRNSAIQTLLRIFDAYGDRLSPEAWSICINTVVFKLLSSIETQLQLANNDESDALDRQDWNETAVVVLNGISGLLANYLDVLTVHPSFNSAWQELLGHFAALLDYRVLDINTATFKALGQILSHSQAGGKQNFNKTTIGLAWDLWSRGIPVAENTAPSGGAAGRSLDNQNCLLAYVSALHEVYRLIQDDLTVERVRRMLSLLGEAIEQASVASYVMDVEYVTPLQGQVLEVLKMVRTDIPGIPSAIVAQVAEFVSLAFQDYDRKKGAAVKATSSKRTYVAMSKASMQILQSLSLRHALDSDIYSSGAFNAGLSALSQPILLKYAFPVHTKSTEPWKLATTCTLAILEAALPQLSRAGGGGLHVAPAAVNDIWATVVAIAGGVMRADCNAAPSSSGSAATTQAAVVAADQDFDIAAFLRLRSLVVPALGADAVAERSRLAYAEALFKTSLVHPLPPPEAALVSGTAATFATNANAGGANGATTTTAATQQLDTLSAMCQPRPGRTVDAPPTRRARMAYVCLDELVALVAGRAGPLEPDEADATLGRGRLRIDDAAVAGGDGGDAATTPTIVVQPPTPRILPPPPARRQQRAVAGTTAPVAPKGKSKIPSHANSPTSDEEEDESDDDDEDDRFPVPPTTLMARLARTAAPFLLVRCAASLRSYAADQPLRGAMPAPASQRRELARLLDRLVNLRAVEGAVQPPHRQREGRTGRLGDDVEGDRMHLRRLYPLLLQVGGVAGRAGDDMVARGVATALGVAGDEFGS